jgi:hypothetical protein
VYDTFIRESRNSLENKITENQLKTAEIICPMLSYGPLMICSDRVLQLSEFCFQRKIAEIIYTTPPFIYGPFFQNTKDA